MKRKILFLFPLFVLLFTVILTVLLVIHPPRINAEVAVCIGIILGLGYLVSTSLLRYWWLERPTNNIPADDTRMFDELVNSQHD